MNKVKTKEQLINRWNAWIRYCAIKHIDRLNSAPTPEMLGIYDYPGVGEISLRDIIIHLGNI